MLPVKRIEELAYPSAIDRPKEAWLFSVLPDCLLRAIKFMVGDGTDTPQILVDAALAAEELKYSTYVNNEDYRSLPSEIEKHQGFRRRVALAIALSEDLQDAATRLTLIPGLVCFTREDLDWLLREAMQEDIDPAERQIWYKIARNIACYDLRGNRRQQALVPLGVNASRVTPSAACPGRSI